MERGTQGDAINPWAIALFRTLQTVEPRTASEQTAYDKWLDQRADREAARNARIHGAVGVIPTPLWIVLLRDRRPDLRLHAVLRRQRRAGARPGHADGHRGGRGHRRSCWSSRSSTTRSGRRRRACGPSPCSGRCACSTRSSGRSPMPPRSRATHGERPRADAVLRPQRGRPGAAARRRDLRGGPAPVSRSAGRSATAPSICASRSRRCRRPCSGWSGWILAFGLALAVDRYENRRAAVVADANAIGTTYLRAQTLAEPIRSRSLALLTAYTDASLRLSEAVPGSAAADRAVAEGDQLQRTLWRLAGQALATRRATAPRGSMSRRSTR